MRYVGTFYTFLSMQNLEFLKFILKEKPQNGTFSCDVGVPVFVWRMGAW